MKKKNVLFKLFLVTFLLNLYFSSVSWGEISASCSEPASKYVCTPCEIVEDPCPHSLGPESGGIFLQRGETLSSFIDIDFTAPETGYYMFLGGTWDFQGKQSGWCYSCIEGGILTSSCCIEYHRICVQNDVPSEFWYGIKYTLIDTVSKSYTYSPSPNGCGTTQATHLIHVYGGGFEQHDELCTVSGLQNCPCSAEASLFSSANIVSGNLSHDQELFAANGAGLGLNMSLYYDSLNTYTGPVGKKWTHTYDINLITMSDGSITLAEGNGHGKRYTKSGSSYISQAGDYSILIKNSDSTYIITHIDNTKYNFNADGKITSIVDRNNNAVTMSYTGGNLTAVTDPVGRSAVFSYNADNRISSIIDPNGNTHSFSYSNNALINVSTQSPQLETLNWSYTYDQDSFMLTKTDPNSSMTTYIYDTNHRVVKAINPEGQAKNLTYSPDAKTAQMIETDGGIWTYKYDTQLGVLLQKIDPNGNITTYTYDQNKNMLLKIDPDGTSTSYTYDNYGNMTSLTDSLGNTTAYTYNNYGQATSVTDSQGNVTRYAYDQKGNLISMTDAIGAVTQYQYDSKGNVVSITNANGQTTTLFYDQYNNISSMTDAAGATTRFTYNAAGNMISQTDSQGNITRFEYNNLNQLIKITDSQNNITTYTYDKNGNKISQTDANGNTTYYEYNYKNQITKVTDPLGGITVYVYGGTGCGSCGSGGGDKLASITDPKGNKTTYEYNSLGKLIKETDPLGNSTAYSYDSKGNLISKTDANGNTIQYTYDALNRLTQKTYPDGSAEAFQYDSKGNIFYAGNQYIAYSFAYDANGKITGVRDSNNRTILYQYDMLGNKIKITTPENKSIEYKYNSSNKLDKILSDAGTFTFTYDSLGRRTKLLYPTGATANYTYDPAGRLTNLTHKTSKGHMIESYKYTLDKVGNRLTKSSVDMEYTYKYDATYQLLQSIPTSRHHHNAETFTYDPVGNRLAGPNDNLTYNYNQGNQLVEKTKEQKHDEENIEYTYDKNGNLIKQIEYEHQGKHTKTTLYTYDYENRLIKVETQKHHSQQTVTFAYDPLGRRISKTVQGEKEFEEDDHDKEHGKDCDKDDDNNNAIKTTYYVYDNEDILMEYNDKGKITAQYTHGLGIDEPLAFTNKHGETYCYHADGLGSIVALTDKKQHVVQTYEYDSFGNMKQQGHKIKQPYMFTGREWDEEIGLYYLRARYFDPLTGRFISKDPIGFAGGDVSLYRYVGNNPVNFTDPMGLASCGSGWNKWVVPDNMFGWYSFSGPCSAHDDCYGCGGAKAGKTKADCDNAFLKGMLSVCATLQQNSYWRNHCEGSANIYYNAVVSKGQSAFDAARKKCCKN